MTETRTDYTTKLCPQCKHLLKERRFTEDLEQVCLDCGHVFDEDEALQPDRLTDAQLDTLEHAARTTVSTDEQVAMLVSGALLLVAEVRDLRLQVEQLAEALEVVTQ